MSFKNRISILLLAMALTVTKTANTTQYHALVGDVKYNIIKNEGIPLIPNPDPWMRFLQDHGQITQLDLMSEVNNSHSISISDTNLTNDDLPLGKMGLLNIGTINFKGNNFDNIDFLEGLESVQDNFNLIGSPLTQIDGLKELKTVGSLDFSSDSTFTSFLSILENCIHDPISRRWCSGWLQIHPKVHKPFVELARGECRCTGGRTGRHFGKHVPCA